jgi:FMN phosphatase YigB (HAD superfamily)
MSFYIMRRCAVIGICDSRPSDRYNCARYCLQSNMPLFLSISLYVSSHERAANVTSESAIAADLCAVDSIIFDAGGVLLLPTEQRFRSAASRLGLHYQSARGAEAMAELVRQGAASVAPAEFWRPESVGSRLLALLNIPPDLGGEFWEMLVAPWGALSAEPPLWSEVSAECKSVLSDLRRRGYRLAVVSNSDGTVYSLLDQLRLAEVFEIVADSAELGVAKPNTEIFQYVADQMKVDLGNCLVVGDDPLHDIDAALRAGVGRTALVDRYRAATSSHLVAPISVTTVLGSLTPLLRLLPAEAPGRGVY